MNWHALESDPNGNTVTIAFHIPIPVANNRVGVPYRTALTKSGIGGKTIMSVGLATGEMTTTEKGQIDSGELFEVVETFHTNPAETSAQLQAKVDARYSALVSPVQSELQKRLTYWGHARNVA